MRPPTRHFISIGWGRHIKSATFRECSDGHRYDPRRDVEFPREGPELANVTWENIVPAMASVGMRSLPNLNVERLVAEYCRIYPDYFPKERKLFAQGFN
jgi:hypothetical protein